MITPDKKYPFKILDVRAQNGQNIKFQLNEISKGNGQAYELQVENLRQKSGRYYDTIILKTDSKIRPEIDVRVYGYLREPKSE